jgi:hypothetical protein
MYSLALFFVGIWFIRALCEHVDISAWLLVTVYWLVFDHAHRRGWLHSPALRRSAFVDWLRRLMRVDFTKDAYDRLGELDPARAIVFACEPHGAQCLHMTGGFAGHGSDMPVWLGEKTRVAAHASTRYFPLVRELLSMFGVVDAHRSTVEDLLQRRHAVALVPSGMYGKEHALLDCPRDAKTVVIYRHRKHFGFIRVAHAHSALLVPVFTPDEVSAYDCYFRRWRIFPLVFFWGKFFMIPKHAVHLHVGQPIDTAAYGENDIDRLANRFYSELAALAPPGYTVEYRFFDD